MNTGKMVMVCAALLVVPMLVFAGDKELFSRIDTDKSSSISRDELLKSDLVAVEGKDGKKQVRHRDLVNDGNAASLTVDQKHRLFDVIDKDKDGFINLKEWKRASPNGFILWKF